MRVQAIVCLVGLALSGCSDLSNPSIESRVSGVVQKGPFSLGTEIQWQDLDSEFVPTGAMYRTETIDNLGNFQLTGIAQDYAEIVADGFYFDEVAGRLSSARLQLRALIEPQEERTVNVNVLTTLARLRIRYLVLTDGLDFESARLQAEEEVLAAIGIIPLQEDPLERFDVMDLSQDNESSAILIAASAIIQSTRSVAEVAELLANIAEDIEEDGTLTDPALRADLLNRALLLSPGEIRQHLESRYPVVAPFEPYLPGPRLVLHYDMEDSPSVEGVPDLSGLDNHGEYVGDPEFVDGARRFDGWGEQIKVDAVEELDLGAGDADFSVMFHIRLETDHTGIWRTLIAKFDGAEETFEVNMHPTTNQVVTAVSLSDDTRMLSYSGQELEVIPPDQEDSFTHVAIVRSGDELRTYFDGVIVKTDTIGGTTDASPGVLSIGSRLPPHGTPSLLDDFRIYDGALGAADIAILAQSRQ